MTFTQEKLKTLAIVFLLVALCVCFYGWVYTARDNAHQSAQITHTENSSATGNQSQYHWRMVTTWPKNFPGLGAAPENFAKLIGELSNGRLKVEVFGAGEIVPAFQTFDAVSSGTVEMGHGASYYWKGKIPASVFFTSVPFGMTIQEQNGWFFYGDGVELWREVYAPFGVRPYPGGSTGVQMGGWFNTEINSLDDIHGLKMRIPGIAGEVFTRAGGTSVSVPGGELFTSLQTGVIDATEFVGPYNDIAFGFNKIAKYYYYPGWHEPGATLEFIINQEAYDALPKDLQLLVDAAARVINADMLDDFAAANANSYQRILNDPEVELRRFPLDVLTEFKRIAGVIYKEQAAEDEMFAKVWTSYKAYLDKAIPYTEISERAYTETRDIVID